MQHLCSRTLKPSHTESFVDAWISSVVASRANPLALLESVREWKTHDTFSHTSETESGSASLELFSSKMLKELSPVKQQTENQFSNMSSENWKDWVTEQRREYSQRVKSERHIRESGSSSSGWPTPTANEDKDQSASWETLSKIDKGGRILRRIASLDRLGLLDPPPIEPRKRWPTPTTAEGSKIGNQPNYGQKGLSNHPEIVGLPDREKLNKSGKNQESPKTPPPKSKGKLNPNWVEQLMGLRIGLTDLGSWETE